MDGFQLKTYRNIRLKILIQVSREMVDSLERVMGFRKEKEGACGVLRAHYFQEFAAHVTEME
jgi:hypothetical protein